MVSVDRAQGSRSTNHAVLDFYCANPGSVKTRYPSDFSRDSRVLGKVLSVQTRRRAQGLRRFAVTPAALEFPRIRQSRKAIPSSIAADLWCLSTGRHRIRIGPPNSRRFIRPAWAWPSVEHVVSADRLGSSAPFTPPSLLEGNNHS